jgi:Spy/CpxP family protein refolding chaperone
MKSGVLKPTMKNQLTILALATAGLLAATNQLRAEDPVPPTPPVNPPPAVKEGEPGPGRPARPGGQRGDRLEMMKEKLGLSAEQVEKLKALFARDFEKMKAIREDATLSDEQKREKARAIFGGSAGEMKAVLTPEQAEKWKAEMERRRTEFQKRRAERDAK